MVAGQPDEHSLRDHRQDSDFGTETKEPASDLTSSVASSNRDMCISGTGTHHLILPHPAEDETEPERKWFEEHFFPRICAQEFLRVAMNLREGDHVCRFGQRLVGGLNVVVFLLFDDGVEWVVKIPRGSVDDGEENMFLMSEYATHIFLQGRSEE